MINEEGVAKSIISDVERGRKVIISQAAYYSLEFYCAYSRLGYAMEARPTQDEGYWELLPLHGVNHIPQIGPVSTQKPQRLPFNTSVEHSLPT